MKTPYKVINILTSGAALAMGLGFTAPRVLAGPGLQYWTGKSQQTQSASKAATLAAVPGVICAQSITVPITEYKAEWPNARGPRRPVQVGTKQVCDLCGGISTVMKPTWPNGRGPLQAVAVAVKHDCNSACVKPSQGSCCNSARRT